MDESPDSGQSVIEALPTTLCTATGQYRFSIWSAQSDVYATSQPQTLITSITSPDPATGQWLLPFVPSESPTCFFQVDFGMKTSNAHGKTYYPLASLMGVIPGCVPSP